MKQRRVTILFVIFACICAGAATGLYFAFRKPSEEHLEQLKKGMSRVEVERIIGGRASEVHGDGVSWWYGTYGSISANFDGNGKLSKCILYPSPAGPLVSLFERIEEDVHWLLNPNEFPSSGTYGKVKMIVPPEDRDVIPPKRLVIFETDGASSTRP